MNKKGDIFQLPVVLIVVFIAALVGLLFLTMTNEVNNFWDKSGLLNQSENAVHAKEKLEATGPRSTDYMIFFLFFGSNLALIISAVRTKFSGMLIFFFLLLLILTVFISSGLVNIYSGFANAAVSQEAADQLTLTGIIFGRFTPLIMTVIGGIIMIMMWGRSGNDIIT